MGLSGVEKLMPSELSGGMRKRVASLRNWRRSGRWMIRTFSNSGGNWKSGAPTNWTRRRAGEMEQDQDEPEPEEEEDYPPPRALRRQEEDDDDDWER